MQILEKQQPVPPLQMSKPRPFKEFWLSSLILMVLSITPLWAQEQQNPFKIHPIDHPGDVGCSFYLSKDQKTQATVFFSNSELAWIHLSWQDLQNRELSLKPLGDPLTRKHEAWVSPEGVELTLVYGKPNENEGGATYNNIRLTLQYKGQRQSVKLKGYCGC